jgi:hypothetical protein
VDIALHDLAVEAALEQVSLVAVPSVEPLRVASVEVLHADRDVRVRRRDEHVVVVRHQAIRVAPPTEPDDDVAEEP